MWSVAQSTGRPIHPSLGDMWLWPHTVMYAVMLRQKYNSYLELSEAPNENIWDFPHLIRAHIEKLYPSKNKASGDIVVDDVEG